jgi:hypothetical protein
LKVLRPNWTTDSPNELLNSNGLFFSIWVDAACEAKGIVRYNLHAKKLRMIKGENFAARDFARSFRAENKLTLAKWPNLTFPVGPITLFEGFAPLDVATLGATCNGLIDRFIGLAPAIDRMIAE